MINESLKDEICPYVCICLYVSLKLITEQLQDTDGTLS